MVTDHGAETSIETAFSGHHWRADIWRASTETNAKAPLTVQLQQASIAPKVGRSIQCQDRSSRTSLTQAQLKRATTLGWISTTHLAWVETCLLPQAMQPIRSRR